MRTNLIVPYAEKDAARGLGARWDSARKVWYVEDVEHLERFMRWIPDYLKKPSVQTSAQSKAAKTKKKHHSHKHGKGFITGKDYKQSEETSIPW